MNIQELKATKGLIRLNILLKSMEDETITVEQVAIDLKLSKATVWIWCKRGNLRGAYKMPGSRKWLISKKEYEKQRKELMKNNYDNI